MIGQGLLVDWSSAPGDKHTPVISKGRKRGQFYGSEQYFSGKVRETSGLRSSMERIPLRTKGEGGMIGERGACVSLSSKGKVTLLKLSLKDKKTLLAVALQHITNHRATYIPYRYHMPTWTLPYTS